MNRNMKPAVPAPRPLTEEQKREMAIKQYLQRRTSIAEGVLYNMVRGNVVADAKGIVKIADDIATEFMKVVCGQVIEPMETTEE